MSESHPLTRYTAKKTTRPAKGTEKSAAGVGQCRAMSDPAAMRSAVATSSDKSCQAEGGPSPAHAHRPLTVPCTYTANSGPRTQRRMSAHSLPFHKRCTKQSALAHSQRRMSGSSGSSSVENWGNWTKKNLPARVWEGRPGQGGRRRLRAGSRHSFDDMQPAEPRQNACKVWNRLRRHKTPPAEIKAAHRSAGRPVGTNGMGGSGEGRMAALVCRHGAWWCATWQ